MGSTQRLRLLFIFVLCCLHMVDAFTNNSTQQSLPSGYSEAEKGKHAMQRGRVAYGAGSGTRNGGESGDNRNNGGQGGAGAIPIYTAGAANNHHNDGQHKGGNPKTKAIGLPLIAIIMVSAAFQIYIVYYC